jgi:hypothetical protein
VPPFLEPDHQVPLVADAAVPALRVGIEFGAGEGSPPDGSADNDDRGARSSRSGVAPRRAETARLYPRRRPELVPTSPPMVGGRPRKSGAGIRRASGSGRKGELLTVRRGGESTGDASMPPVRPLRLSGYDMAYSHGR